MLEARGLSKRFGRTAVLSDAAFSVREGEILGLIGPNGAGKTTLFEILAGLLPADAGHVTFRGALVPPARRKEVLYYVPDAVRPWRDQRVTQVLTLFEEIYRTDSSAIVARLELDALCRSRLGALSKGELKRLTIAIGLLTPHPLLLLDEPFDGLDFRQTRDVMEVLREARRTLFLSIHQLTDAARVCDRLVLLSRGRVVGEGPLDELRSRAGVGGGGLEEVFLALT